MEALRSDRPVRAPSVRANDALRETDQRASRPVRLPEEPSGVEREFRASMRAMASPKAQAAQVMTAAASRFAELADDKRAFHATLKSIFGPGYDKDTAEAYRQRALAGDFTWLPPIRFADSKELNGAHGAYDADANVIYLNKNLLTDPALAAQVYTEELGHFLDSRLNPKDSPGDEGELFRRVLGGEALTPKEIAAIRAENDHGTITVDGKQIEVEFWNPFKAIGDAVSGAVNAVGDAVSDAAGAVGDFFGGAGRAIGDAASSIGAGFASIGKGIVGAGSDFFGGIGEGVGGFFGNLFQGDFEEAFGSLAHGLDRAFIKGPTRLFNGVLDGVDNFLDVPRHLLPGPLGDAYGWVKDRVWDAGRGLVTGVWDAATSVGRNLVESGGQILHGIGEIFRGNFAEGFKDIGVGLLKGLVQTPVDALLLVGGRVISAVQTLVGLEPPGRRLTADEIATLRSVYGDSIDYDAVRIKEGSAGLFSTNDRPFTHGNTVYMKDSAITDELLIHEMAHVWQHQNGGSDYMSEALISQNFGHGYDWEASVPQTPWEELEPEQQAEFLEHLYGEGYFDPSSPNYRRFAFDADGDGRPEDHSDYARDAVFKVRRGVGAP